MKLRDYQENLVRDIDAAWSGGARNVIAASPTGSGKTVIFSHILARETGPAIAIAHRQELVSQISLSLARYGVPHGVIAPREVVREIINIHHLETGAAWISPNSRIQVAGVDTLGARAERLAPVCARVGLWVMDEAHHILRANKWGKALKLFPHARGLGVTATPGRADGRGLGRHAEGVMDALLFGVPMAELQSRGYLTRYRIFAPPSDLDLSGLEVSAATGDYVPQQLSKRVEKSHITGDVVTHYLRLAPGRLGVTFASDVKTAGEIAEKFRAAGVAAELVTAKTPTRLRSEIMRKFRARQILQVVNVDLFGEGFDLPALEVVSMARPTQSYGLYCQQFGRALRPMEGKDHALILDHVGNVARHGLPDGGRAWTLDSRKRRRAERDPDMIPITVCTACTGAYEAILKVCPYCGHTPVPSTRSAPDQVAGDLTELDAATLDRLRGAAARIDRSPCEVAAAYRMQGLEGPALAANLKRHQANQDAQAALRDRIALWGGYRRHLAEPDSVSYRRFYFKFGTDVLSAQSAGRADAEVLTAAIDADLAGRAVARV